MTWAALAVVLTVIGAVVTLLVWRRRGAASGLRMLALTLLPAAAWLTGMLEMLTRIVGAVADWATGLVLSPVVWTGFALFGIAALLFVVSGVLRGRQLARATGPAGGAARGGQAKATRSGHSSALPKAQPTAQAGAQPRSQTEAKSGGSDPILDDDMSDIEDILRRRGIE